MAEKPIRVVIVDDSLVAREMLRQILSSDPGIEVAGIAKDGQEGVSMVGDLRPDLVTMDIHMPKMDGLSATEQIMAYTPTPILVVSSSVHGEGIGLAFDALSAGALEVMKKPEPKDWAEMERIGRDVIRRVKILSKVHVITHVRGRHGKPMAKAPAPADEVRTVAGYQVVAIGSSTGGPSALQLVLGGLPAGFPLPIVVAQHIADGFVPGLVEWLASNSRLPMKQADDGEKIEPGVVYFSPTGVNMRCDGTKVRFVEPRETELYIPSADALFESCAFGCGKSAIGVILTGMGSDGARGLKKMADAGAMTIAQDEASSVVYGMPKAAFEAGAARKVLPVEKIAETLQQLVARKR